MIRLGFEDVSGENVFSLEMEENLRLSGSFTWGGIVSAIHGTIAFAKFLEFQSVFVLAIGFVQLGLF